MEIDSSTDVDRPLLDTLGQNSTDVESTLPVQRLTTSRKKKRAGVKPFLTCCACGSLVVVMVAVCVVGAWLGAPTIATSVVNNADFTVHELRFYELSDPKENLRGDIGWELPVHMSADIGVSSALSAEVEGVHVEVLWNNINLASFSIDKHSIQSGKGSIDHDATLVIENKASLQDLAAFVMDNKAITYTLKGTVKSVDSKIVGVPVPFSLKGITFEKDLTLDGFSHMDNLINLGEFDFSKSTHETAVVETDITVTNPTTLVMDNVGDLEMEVRSVPQPGDGSPEEGWLIGSMKIERVFVPAKGSKAVFHSTATFIVGKNLEFAQEFAHKFMTSHPVSIHTITTGGTNEIWVEMFKKLSIAMDVSGPNALSFIQNPAVKEVSVDPHSDLHEGKQYYTTSATLSFDVKCPVPKADINFKHIAGEFTILYNDQPISTGKVDNDMSGIRDGDIYTVSTAIKDVPAVFVEDAMVDNFAAFAKDFVEKDEVLVTIQVNVKFDIDTSLDMKKLLPLKDTYSVDFKLQGLKGLKGTEVTELDLPRDHPSGGVESMATVKATNPSVGTLRLGESSFVLNVDGVDLGEMTVPDKRVKPGVNTLKLDGYVLPKEEDREAAGKVFSRIISGDKVAVKAHHGKSNQFPGVEWLRKVLEDLVIETEFQPPDYGELIRNPVVQSGEVLFLKNPSDSDAPWGQLMSGRISAEFANPYGFPLKITKTDMKTTTYDVNDNEFSHLSANDIPVEMGSADGKSMIEFEISKVPLVVDSINGMQEVWSNAINKLEEILPLKCDTSPYVSSAMGEMTFPGIKVESSIALEGVGGFKDPPIEVTKVDLRGGDKDKLDMSIDLTITPQPKVTLAFDMQSTLKLCMEYKGEILGSSGIEMFRIEPHKPNDYNARSSYTAGPQSAPGQEFLSNYLNMVDTNINLKGCEDGSSTEIPMLHQALKDFNTPVTIKGAHQQLMKDCVFEYRNLVEAFTKKILPATASFYNPFSAKVEIVACNFKVSGAGSEIGSFVLTEADEPIVMEPAAESHKEMPVHVEMLKLKTWLVAIEAIVTGAKINVDGTVKVRVEEFVMELHYTQKGIPLHH